MNDSCLLHGLRQNPIKSSLASKFGAELVTESLYRTNQTGAGFSVRGGSPELGHIKKHCKQEVPEMESNTLAVQCVYCQEVGHRARDCPQERVNCKQEGYSVKECPEPRSAEGVECHKCNEIGHFSKDCPNVEARNCRNCGSADYIAKECDQPRNPDTCRNCEKVGHSSRDCPERKDWSKTKLKLRG